MTIKFVEQAKSEFLDGISEYESIHRGLGQRFKEEADKTILWIASNPEIFRTRPNGYRRVNLKIFPYYIPFIVREDVLWIVAVAHERRLPEYWISRITTAG